MATAYVTGGSVIGGQGRNECGEETAPITTSNNNSMVCHCPRWFMIRTDFSEYLLHPNHDDLQLSDSVMFVNVSPVASSVTPTDIAVMDQGAGIRMSLETE